MNCIDGKNLETKEKKACNFLATKTQVAKVRAKSLLNSQETLNSYMYTFKYRDKKEFLTVTE